VKNMKVLYINQKLKIISRQEMLTENPSFWIILANFFAAKNESSSLLAPVHTNLPERKISAVALGFCILIINPVNLAGLYSEFLVLTLIYMSFNSVCKLTVETTFLQK